MVPCLFPMLLSPFLFGVEALAGGAEESFAADGFSGLRAAEAGTRFSEFRKSSFMKAGVGELKEEDEKEFVRERICSGEGESGPMELARENEDEGIERLEVGWWNRFFLEATIVGVAGLAGEERGLLCCRNPPEST